MAISAKVPPRRSTTTRSPRRRAARRGHGRTTDQDGRVGVACANVEAQTSRADVVETYEGYAFDHPVDFVAGWREAVRRLAERLGVGGRIAGERGFVPAGLEGLLA